MAIKIKVEKIVTKEWEQDAKMKIPVVIDADSIQAQAEARIRGNVA